MAPPVLRLALPLLSLVSLCAAVGTSPPCSTSASIANGNFEAGSLGPWQINDPNTLPGGNISLVSPGDNSGHAVQLSAMSSGASAAIMQQGIPVCRATNYTVTFDYKITGSTKGCALYAYGIHGDTRSAHQSQSPAYSAQGSWKSGILSYPNYVAETFQLVVSFACTGKNSGEALFDNFVITPVGSLEPDGCPGRAVSIPNGDFESGQLTPWKFTQNEPPNSIVSPGYNSNHALEIQVPSSTTYWELSQHFDSGTCLSYNYTYTFAYNFGNYTFQSNKKTDGCWLVVDPYSCTSNSNGPTYYPTDTASGWHEISFTCLPDNSKNTFFLIQLQCQIEVGQSNVPPFALTVDGFTVQATP